VNPNRVRGQAALRRALDDDCGREACERCQGREISHRTKAPPKGPIVCGPLRRLPLGQPTELGVDRLGDSNGGHHHEHNKSKPGLREAPGGAAALQGEYCRGGFGVHASLLGDDRPAQISELDRHQLEISWLLLSDMQVAKTRSPSLRHGAGLRQLHQFALRPSSRSQQS
jgi:hypothetical protein